MIDRDFTLIERTNARADELARALGWMEGTMTNLEVTINSYLDHRGDEVPGDVRATMDSLLSMIKKAQNHRSTIHH